MNNTLYKSVATLIRMEKSEHKDNLFLVFEVTDEDFKQRIKKDWTADISLELVEKELIELKEK